MPVIVPDATAEPPNACRQLEGWKQHKPLWQESKATVLEKFAARCPDTAGWEQQMRQYSALAAELTAQVWRSMRLQHLCHLTLIAG